MYKDFNPRLNTKRAAGIVLIVLLGPISLPAGIVALVYNWNVRASIAAGRYDDAERQSRVARTAILVGLVGLVIQAFTGHMLFDDFAVRLPKFHGNFYEFELEGNKITLPIEMDEFDSFGYLYEKDIDGYYVNPGENEYMEIWNDQSLYRQRSRSFGEIKLYNPYDEPVTLRDAIVISVSVTNWSAYDTIYSGGRPALSAFGIDDLFGATYQQVADKLGKPDNKTSYGIGEIYATWYPHGDDAYNDRVYLNTENGRISYITIQYTGDYYY